MTLAQLLETMTSRELRLWEAKARIESEDLEKLREEQTQQAHVDQADGGILRLRRQAAERAQGVRR